MGRQTRLVIALIFFVVLLAVALVPIFKSFIDDSYRGAGTLGATHSACDCRFPVAIGKK